MNLERGVRNVECSKNGVEYERGMLIVEPGKKGSKGKRSIEKMGKGLDGGKRSFIDCSVIDCRLQPNSLQPKQPVKADGRRWQVDGSEEG
jgi:hypothetical protein